MCSLKKKVNQFENEVTEKFNTQTKCIPIFYGDRFIPRRFVLKNCDRNLKFSSKKTPKDALALRAGKDYWRENAYLPVINLIMQMRQERILRLMDPVVESTGLLITTRYQVFNEKHWSLYDWPCKPRSKPSASLDSTYDLPEHDSSCDQNLVGWSTRGHIAVSFGRDLKIWQSKEDITMSFDVKYPGSLAYSHNGKFLAVGCKSFEYPVLELWDVSSSQEFIVVSGKAFHSKHVAVQCVQWNSSDKQIVCGTYYGCLYILSVPDMNTIKKIRKHLSPITLIRFSPNSRYLASGDSEGNVIIYNWNMCRPRLYVRSRRKLNTVFDWHPWTGVDLVIAEEFPASIIILHVPSKKILAYYQQNELRVAINYISFSKLTGELLVSISKPDGSAYNGHKVLVMSSLDKIVDVLTIPDGGTRFLMWSPDGTMVATTNNDEDLCLWNFYSLKTSKYFKKLNEAKEKTSTETEFGNQFRRWCFFR